jgi:alpha-L-rhamnosidase
MPSPHRPASVLVLAAALGLFSAARSSAAPQTQPAAAGVPITRFGAVGDGRTLNTRSIQAGIDQLSATGGGALVVPEGVFLSGAIFIKPGVQLRLEKGGVLKGSTDILDYPKATTRIEGHSEAFLPALVNANRVDHLQITGEGTLDGSGPPFWASFWKRRKEDPHCTNLEVLRPRLIFLQDCHDVLISGITLKDSGFWNLHLYRCQDAVLEHLDIHVDVAAGERAPSTDGMDIDSSQRVTVFNCTISVHDDCIALKGTKGPFALDDKASPAVEHVRISGCTFNAGGAALTCGSEATDVHDVVMDHCVVNGDLPLLHLKLRPDTPQHYHDIHVNDIVMHSGSIFEVAPWSQFFDLRGQPTPGSAVNDVSVSGVTGSFDSFGKIKGNKATQISNITLSHFDVQLKTEKFEHQEINGLDMQDLKVNGRVSAVK